MEPGYQHPCLSSFSTLHLYLILLLILHSPRQATIQASKTSIQLTHVGNAGIVTPSHTLAQSPTHHGPIKAMAHPHLVLTTTPSAHFHHFDHLTWPDPLHMLTIVLFPTRIRIYLTHAHPLRPRLLLCVSIHIQPYHHLRSTLPLPTVHLRLDRLLFNLGIRELGVDCAINVLVVVSSPSCSLRRLLAQFVEGLEESFR